MKKIAYSFLFLVMLGCGNDDIRLFDKSADERSVEAINNLKNLLMAPGEGWKLKYTPDDGSGSFYVFLKFEDGKKVNIRTDFGAENGNFFNQTINYRVANAQTMQLIFENYSFFSFLYELDESTFPAEFEFIFVNETPQGDIVFVSKSDIGSPTILVFQEATAGEADEVLGTEVSENLNTMADDLASITSVMKLTYEDKDVILFLSLDELKRTIRVTRAVRKSNTANTVALNFNSPYVIQGDSIVLNTRLTGTYFGAPVSLKGIKFNALTESQLNVCASPITLHAYEGVTSANDNVVLESTLADVRGGSFVSSDFYYSPLGYIKENGEYVYQEIFNNIEGALAMQLYYANDFYGIGFIIGNADGTTSFALRQFTPVLTGNKIKFNFAPTVSLFGAPTPANINNVNIYLDALTAGDETYIFEQDSGVYEFFNPCTGFSITFFDAR